MKLEDVNDLQAAVAEHAESVEAGLKVLDTCVSMGGATIDLLAVDTSGSLTLVALGFVADDEMLMRALEAFSWCQEDPEEVRRLYPMARLSGGQPPRVIFVAEQLPDAFLRKARHLRLHRVDFVRFQFGLQFIAVDVPRKSDEPARPSAPVPARPVEPARPVPAASRRPSARAVAEKLRVADGRRTEARTAEPTRAETKTPAPAEAQTPPPAEARPDLLDGLKLPSNGNLSSQWQRALERRPGDLDEWKVKVVREYLQREFPSSVIYDFFAQDRCVQMFHLQDNLGAVIHTATVAEDLLVDFSESEIGAFLDKQKLARVLRQAGQAGVTVAKAGLKIQPS